MNPDKQVLILKTCKPDMTSYGGFKWPESGPVEAPDWDGGLPVCGGKLHGFLWGEGDGMLANWDPQAKWLVISALASEVVEITENNGGKVGFRRGEILFCGTRHDATKFLATHGATNSKIIGGISTAGDRGTAISGDRGTAISGDGGTAIVEYRGSAIAGDNGYSTGGYGSFAIAGYGGNATSGNEGSAIAGYGGNATSGNEGSAIAGDKGYATVGTRGLAITGYGGTATSGDSGISVVGGGGIASTGFAGIAIAGDDGTAISGDRGISIVGDRGNASAGYEGVANAGYRGNVQASEKGILKIKTWDGEAGRFRIAIAYVGENGILPNVPYRFDVDGFKVLEGWSDDLEIS